MGSNYGRFMSYASQGNLIGMQQFLESLHPEEASSMVHYEDGVGGFICYGRDEISNMLLFV